MIVKKPRLLLGGVPFGMNNIGDEAILENTIYLLRDRLPNARIGVCTADSQETAEAYNVEVFPPYGFDERIPADHFRHALKGFDWFFWTGATGLSAYPDVGSWCFDEARRINVQTGLLCCGMDNTLNPVKYKVLPGKKKKLLTFFKRCTWDKISFVQIVENHRRKKILYRLTRALQNASFLSVRDMNTAKKLFTQDSALNPFIGADPAIVQKRTSKENLPLTQEEISLLKQEKQRIALSISTQQSIENLLEVAEQIDRWIQHFGAHVIFLPVNRETDRRIYDELQTLIKQKDSFSLIQSCRKPADFAGILAQMDVVISSRLHCLVLASCSHVPLIGISRKEESGSKIESFLAEFDLKSSGHIRKPDWEGIFNHLQTFLYNPHSFQKKSRIVSVIMKKRLNTVFDLLAKRILSSLDKQRLL